MPETFPDHPHMAGMPSAPRQRLRYARILDAAGSYARKGLDTVDLPEVAAKADVPLGTLLRYFPTPPTCCWPFTGNSSRSSEQEGDPLQPVSGKGP